MRLLIDIHNDADIRLLLVDYDESYPEYQLIEIYDDIMREFEILDGGNNYSKFFREIDSLTYEQFKLQAIDVCLTAIENGVNDGAKKIIDAFGFNVVIDESKNPDHKAIGSMVKLGKSIKNRVKIKLIKQQEQKNKKESNKIVISWEEKRSGIHVSLGILPEYDCTVALYMSYENRLKEKNAAIEKAKANDNGRRSSKRK